MQLVDIFIRMAYPQKYADSALHDGYLLRPLATHAAVSVVVLNQVDKPTEIQRRACVNHLTRLLEQNGLGGVDVLSTSAVTGEGLESLRETLVTRVRQEQAGQRSAGRRARALPPPWPGCIKRKTPLAGDELTSALDAAV